MSNNLGNEQVAILEGMLNPKNDALAGGDVLEMCLHVYAKHDKPLNVELLKATCEEEFGAIASKEQISSIASCLTSKDLLKPGYIQKSEKDGVAEYAITDVGLAYLWDNLAMRNSEEALDKYATVIAINKKLNAPDRKIETHDLYALMLLAVLKLEHLQGATASDVCKVLVDWVKPTGINAEALPSEMKYANPQTRFARKVHNVLSSHNNLEKDGFIERLDSDESGSWRVTGAGRALLMKRTLKERRNLTMMMQAASISKDMAHHMAAMSVVSSYGDLATTVEEKNAVTVMSRMIQTAVEKAAEQVKVIKSVLGTPETAKAEYITRKPKP